MNTKTQLAVMIARLEIIFRNRDAAFKNTMEDARNAMQTDDAAAHAREWKRLDGWERIFTMADMRDAEAHFEDGLISHEEYELRIHEIMSR